MTNIKPKVYPAEFKKSAIKLAIESKQPLVQWHSVSALSPKRTAS